MHTWRQLATILVVLASSGADAGGLLDAYRAAVVKDPTLRAARHERDAGQQASAIGLSGLLPNVSISSNRANNAGERNLTQGTLHQPLDYRSSQDTLSLRQPIFNYDSIVRYQQGDVQSAYSAAVFSKKEGEMVVRVALAYFDVLQAGEKLAFADAEVLAYGDQRRLAQRRKQAGEGTLTEIAETDARLAIAEANRADAVDQIAVARRALEDMTGQSPGTLRRLKDHFVPSGPQPASLEEWAAIALERSPEIIAQRKQLESAGLEVERNRAGHMPRLDFVASASKSDSATLDSLNQQSNVRTVGLQLSIPLFAGMGVVAQTDQAVANRERAAAELDAVIDKVQLELRRWFLAVGTGVTKVTAYDRAVNSGTVAVEGTKRGMGAGIRTNSDVLDAERMLFSALRDRAQARYDFLASTLKLKATAGNLSEPDVAAIDELLEPQGSRR